MTVIDIADPQTDKLLGSIENGVGNEQAYWGEVREQGLDGVHTFEFFTDGRSAEAALIQDLSRIIIPARRGGFHEFVAYEIENDSDGEMRVTCLGSETELDVLRIIEAGKWENFVVADFFDLAISGTGWQVGYVETTLSKNYSITEDTTGYTFLRSIANLYGMELHFRIDIQDNRIIGRYVDLLERVGRDDKQEIVKGENLISMSRKVNNREILTALQAYGPEREDGTQLKRLVTDTEAFRRWNFKGQHRIQKYTPETSDEDMTESRLISLARTELNKRINSIVEYEVEAVLLPDTALGDTVRIKDESFEPPLYAESRVVKLSEGLSDSDTDSRTYTIGEIKELKKEDVMRDFLALQETYGALIYRGDTPPERKINVEWTDTSGTIDIGKTWNPDTQQWEKKAPTDAWEINAVDVQDYNGMTVLDLLNDPTVTGRIIADRIQLVGAVDVLSDISGNLGTINTGKINLLQMAGADEKILFGEDINNPDGRIDYAEDSMRFQSDASTYLKVNRGGTTGFESTNVTSAAIVQLYGAGAPMFNFGFLEQEFKHRTIQAGNTRLKFLNGEITALQVRNVADTALAPIHASELVTQSVRELKRNIEPYAKNATQEIITTPVHSYKFLGDTENDLERMGLIYDEAPADIVNVSGFGIDVYSMASMLWKGFQEQEEKIQSQDERIAALEDEKKQMRLEIDEIKKALADSGSGVDIRL